MNTYSHDDMLFLQLQCTNLRRRLARSLPFKLTTRKTNRPRKSEGRSSLAKSTSDRQTTPVVTAESCAPKRQTPVKPLLKQTEAPLRDAAVKSGGRNDCPQEDQKIYQDLVAANFSRLHTYDDLEALSRIPGYAYLARDVKIQQMKFLCEGQQDVTQVDLCDFDSTLDPELNTGKLDLSGILHSIDIDYLNTRLRKTHCDSYAILSIHPDDWVAGKSQPLDPEQRWCNWSLHGKLKWNTRKTGDPVVEEELLSLQEEAAGQPPRSGLQHGRSVTSPVVDHQVVELADEGTSPLLRYLPNAIKFIDTHSSVAGRRVLVHCKVGHSRSASVVVAYLMYKYHQGVVADSKMFAPWEGARPKIEHMRRKCDELLRWLKSKREGVKAPDDQENNFVQQLYAYADYLVTGTMPSVVPTARVKRAGGDQMRDAAAVVFFNHKQRPCLNIIRHYFERRKPTYERFPVEMYDFMLKWLPLENLAWDPEAERLENVQPNP